MASTPHKELLFDRKKLTAGVIVLFVALAIVDNMALNVSVTLQQGQAFSSTRCVINEFSSSISTVRLKKIVFYFQFLVISHSTTFSFSFTLSFSLFLSFTLSLSLSLSLSLVAWSIQLVLDDSLGADYTAQYKCDASQSVIDRIAK